MIPQNCIRQCTFSKLYKTRDFYLEKRENQVNCAHREEFRAKRGRKASVRRDGMDNKVECNSLFARFLSVFLSLSSPPPLFPPPRSHSFSLSPSFISFSLLDESLSRHFFREKRTYMPLKKNRQQEGTRHCAKSFLSGRLSRVAGQQLPVQSIFFLHCFTWGG